MALEQLKKITVVVADTGDFESEQTSAYNIYFFYDVFKLCQLFRQTILTDNYLSKKFLYFCGSFFQL